MSTVKKYVSVWRLTFLNGMQYRTAALAGMSTQLFFGFIFIMIFAAFYKNASAAAMPMQWKEVVSYMWMQQIFLTLVMLWVRDTSLFQLITSGNIAYELCRPMHLYPFWYMKLMAQRLSALLLRCVPITIIVLLLPEKYRLDFPPSFAQAMMFLLVLATGLLLTVAISMFIYITVFWTMNPTGSTLMISVAGEFFAGLVIPVPMMPAWMQEVTYYLPFRWTTDFPFRVYSGHISIAEAWVGFSLQLGWLVVLVSIGIALIQKGLKQVVIQGG